MKSVLTYLGYPTFVALYILGVLYFRKHRAWLTYYVLATFGLVLIMVFSIKLTGLDAHIEYSELFLVKYIALPLGVKVLQISANTIQVSDNVGPIALTMGIESSAIIEISALIGLLLYYPAFNWQRKLRLLSIGLIVTIIANLLRILIIVSSTHYMGRETIFISHALIGRLFFLACVIVLFWYVITRPTIDEISKTVRGTG